MKVGSIVECVDNQGVLDIVYPLSKTVYTIRAILPNRINPVPGRSNCGVLLEEIKNGICSGDGLEFSYCIKRFREIQFPDDLMEQVKECLTIKELRVLENK